MIASNWLCDFLHGIASNLIEHQGYPSSTNYSHTKIEKHLSKILGHSPQLGEKNVGMAKHVNILLYLYVVCMCKWGG
jgi:hypothetical protein